MIGAEYVREMARYNSWQNNQLIPILRGLNDEVLNQERGAYFGSILATANHILWSDQLWMSRFANVEAPAANFAKGTEMTASLQEWEIQRFRTDSAINRWAKHIKSIDLTGYLNWFSVVNHREYSKPIGVCIMHMFNHQTHHRGQLHVMLTSVGCQGAVTDVTFMPDKEDCL
ncbi:MAG: DinB family protein [Pelagimonas sp.]|uniref:DinB family protein n=1 Tax=Pelagimonas sp. TaxID=2073170 RepID=UPI003D6B83DE